jgi:hypothetical protein
VRHGGNGYAETARYNYSPVWSWLLLSFSLLADLLHLPLHVIVRGSLALIGGNAMLRGLGFGPLYCYDLMAVQMGLLLA